MLDRLALGLASASVLVMTVLGGLDVLGTAVLNRPIPTTYEATETLMVLVVFLSLTHLGRARAHIAIDLAVVRMPMPLQRAIGRASHALAACFFGLVAWTGWALAWESFRVGEYAAGLVPFPLYPSKFALALGASLAALQALYDIVASAERNQPS
jgi:TRAP-type C4-dicarboxylate transport system permease small subunit